MMAAFFDMDRTLLRVNSGTLWMRFLWRRGEISRMELARAMAWALQYKMALLDMDVLSRRLVADLAGQSEADMIEKVRGWFEVEILPQVSRAGREAIERHRACGERVVLLTGSTPYVAEPLSAALGLDAVLCSRLEVQGGRFTGRLVEPLCFGHGKVALAEAWAREAGVDLAHCTFYTDSFNDLPMLERVGRPVAVNPDPRLARHARRRRWPVEIWDRP